MVTEAIILAGGKGTRLRSVVSDLPKPMAPINDLPFLSYILNDLHNKNIKKVYLAVGYLNQKIISYYGNSYKNIEIDYVIEHEPLGTGGAIKKAIEKTKSPNVLIVNGDTLFEVSLSNFFELHSKKKAGLSLALKYEENADRYGTVSINVESQITEFNEKKEGVSGWINGGVYLINKEKLKLGQLPSVFSFEKEVLEKEYQSKQLYGYKSNGYFIDIGIPSDYQKAHKDFLKKSLKVLPKVNKKWTLFLDRDGVINKKRENDYVKSISEFIFLPNSKSAIKNFNNLFGKVLVVTNQQCVGKGIVSEKEIEEIHSYMLEELSLVDAKIDKIYFAPDLASESNLLRKPNTGMAELAQKDHPEIDFSKSIMVGDSVSDMEFGKRKGMVTIGINLKPSNLIDFHIGALADLVHLIDNK